MSGLSDTQWQILQNLLSALIGVGGSMGIQWIKERKSQSELVVDNTNTIVQASGESLKAAQEVVTMLQNMLDLDRNRFEEDLKREIAEAKEQCNKQVESLRNEHAKKLEDLILENERLNVKVIQLTNDNREYAIKMALFVADKEQLEIKVQDLKMRLGKYETEIITDKMKVITQQQIEDDKAKRAKKNE